MKNKKRKKNNKLISNLTDVLVVLFILLVIGFIVSYFYNETYKFNIIENNIELKLKENYNINVIAKNPKNNDKNNYIFTSSDNSIATVDELGNITPVSEGNVEITIKSKKGFNRKKINLTIKGKKEDLFFVNDTYAVMINGTVKLELNSFNNLLNNVKWEISDISIATVDSSGVIHGHKEGEVTVTATLENGINTTCKVIVQNKEVMPESITLSDNNISLGIGQSYNIKATILPENSTNKDIKWESSDSTKVEVNNGMLYARNYGKAVITATTINGKKQTCTVTVSDIKVDSITLNKTNITLGIGATESLTVFFNPSNATNKELEWTSNNPSIATVSKGLITGKKEGTTKITVTTSNGKKATASVTVKKINPTAIILNKTSLNLIEGQTENITAVVKPSNASVKEITWSSSDSNIASVNEGTIYAKKEGTVKVTAKIVGTNITSTVTVRVSKVKVTGIQLDKTSGTIYLNKNNKTIQVNATVIPENAANKTIKWSSNNSNVATVNNNGLVTGINPGTATITALTEDSGFKAQFNVTVKKKAIVVITASQGVRMDKWFETYTSKNGNYYSKANKTLKYVYLSGSGFEFQYGDGLTQALNYIKEQYSTIKNYVELNVYFTLTGNSVKTFTCDQIGTSSEYNNIASKYNSSIQKIKDQGYNVNGFVITHSPLNTKHPLASSKKIVYSHKAEACKSGYRSAWKYHLSNNRMKKVLNTGNYPNIKIVDNWSNFLRVTDETNRKFEWLQKFTTPSDDPLHWDEPTTKLYMQLAFDTANM
ncbi:MAG: Ig-like domain-containing protein [Bacilli bacterium]|nr:Ig-like domain-containing protein [Bacilli bacterium]